MNFISEIFGYPLGWIMWAIFKVIPSYGIAIIIFTLITKFLLMPLTVKQEKNAARMSAFQPKMQALQKKYAKNPEKLQEEQMKLYSEENINPMGSCLPMFIQFPILFGIIDVVYRPLTHLFRISKDLIAQAQAITVDFYTAQKVTDKVLNNIKYRPELYIIEAYQQNPSAFSSIPEISEKLQSFDLNFLCWNLGQVPDWTFPAFLIPVLAGLSQLAMTVYMQWKQKKDNPSAPSMGAMNIMLYAMPIMSIWFAFALPMGVGFYWIIQSLVSFGQTVMLKKIYNKEKIEEILKKEKENSKKKKKKSMMQRMMEQQKALQEMQGDDKNSGSARDKVVKDYGDVDNLSKSAQKEIERKIIAEARRRQAEKYGEEYNGDSEE